MGLKSKSLLVAAMCGSILSVEAADIEAVSAASGTVKGRVLDTDDQALPGASIYIDALKTGVVSDMDGFYTLSHIAPGTYHVTVTYVGFAPFKTTITVAAGSTNEFDLRMQDGTGVQLNTVVVDGVFNGQSRAISQQKNKMGITNVVSADQVGKFPDSNIGDALKRISGINVQYDMGEARFGQVRGTAADFSSVTINGNRMPAADANTRDPQLDLVPADMVQSIEVNKVITADMDGDAIGGSIDLITKSSPTRRMINATASTGYNVVSKKPLANLGFTYGDRYLDGHLGMILSGSYQYNPGGSDNVQFEYVENDGAIELYQAQVRKYFVNRERQSYSLALDYKFNADHKIAFKGIYNRRNDWENRYRASYKKLNSSASKQSVVLQDKAGSDDSNGMRLERQQVMDFTIDGEHQFGVVSADWAASFARATEDRPRQRYIGVKYTMPFSDTFQDVGERKPYTTQTIPALSADGWKLDELSEGNENVKENEWKFRANFQLPILQGDWGNTLKFGAKYVHKSKSKEAHTFDYADSYTAKYGNEWKNHPIEAINSGFMAGSEYVSPTQFVDKEYVGSIDLTGLDCKEYYEDASGNYSATEEVGAAYVRLDQKLGSRLSMVAGLRMEHTALNYSGYIWEVDDAGVDSFTPTGDKKNHYTNWLPSVLFKFDANDDCKIRASYTQSLSRPKYSYLVPSIRYSVGEETAYIGNPDLKPTTSKNLDFDVEYYFKTVGLVTAGVFYKDITNVSVDEMRRSRPNEIPGMGEDQYLIDTPGNAYDASLFGVEVAYQRDFSFIAPALRCVGFYGTYTYTHSKTKNYRFQYREVQEGERILMTGSPEHTANASLFFDKAGFNIRLSYNFASSFIDQMETVAALDHYYDHVNYLDLNASYRFGRKWRTTIFADVTNLLNQPLRYYQGVKERTMQVEYYGVKFDMGVKVSF